MRVLIGAAAAPIAFFGFPLDAIVLLVPSCQSAAEIGS
jgi:hypothetical protein